MKLAAFLIIYLIGFPVTGLVIGYVFFKIMELINGPLSQTAFEISMFVWGSTGLLLGIYCTIFIYRITTLSKKLEKTIEQGKSGAGLES